MSDFGIPTSLMPYKDELEKTLRPYAKITTEIVEEATLKQSKFLGKPYLPKAVGLPHTQSGAPMYLLALCEQSALEEEPYKLLLQIDSEMTSRIDIVWG